MRADGRDEDDGVVWVAEGAAGGEVVGGGSRGGGDADAVGEDGGHEFFVHEEFGAGHCCGGFVLLVVVRFLGEDGGFLFSGKGGGEEGDVIITWIRAAVDDDVVENRVGPIWPVRQVVLRLIANQFFDEIVLLILLRRLRPHDGGFEPQPQAHRDAVFEGCTQRLLMVGIVEFGEEA